MQRFSTRMLALATGLAVVAFVAPPAAAQTGDGWTTLVDASKMGDWDRVGESNWRMEDGALVADKRSGDVPPTWSRKLPTKTL
jgi:hypothetical protein